MDWNQELLASVIWLGKAFVISLMVMIVVVIGLSRFTAWGRQFRRLTWA